ncbi:transferase family hexapeptide repeat protein [Paenibacillus pabuli]|uniref:Transferase family hexapeptide repeat protein n=1 Tax=Paenibacillus pabuli TaxID=1472 RepID=A0ABX9BHL4_9BACL|nr:CatB-related O-acetyltransferase [Paenibacillus pabuli]RAI93600.1 transferase family hexapeptide repeat protein [Paenibacillus pabuli]
MGNDVWIGQNVTIMPGVTIGDGAIVASNATVTKDIEPYTIVGGNPVKPIKRRFDDMIIALLLELKWWDQDEAWLDTHLERLVSTYDRQTLRELLKSK